MRRKDAATEKKDSEPAHNSKGHNESNQKKDDKVDSTQKTRVIHHKMHDKKHTEDDWSKFHDMNSKSLTNRHGKQQHYVDKCDKHKLTKPESSVVNKSHSRRKQTESVEVLEKANIKASMEHERCELIDDDQPDSDQEMPPEEEGDISNHSIGDNQVERISYTKVNTLCNGIHYILSLFLTERIDGTEKL